MRSSFGGRHELGQNFLCHEPTLDTLTQLVQQTHGPILEIGAGDGALTKRLAQLGRNLHAVDLDERRVKRLQSQLSGVTIMHADALHVPLDRQVIVGNLPFHLTTPILRRLLRAGSWHYAVLLTQWEVARKRAGVGGSTIMTAQMAPWFEFSLHGRVPADGFKPKPSVDGGVLAVSRRNRPSIAPAERGAYRSFVHTVFTGRGRGMGQILSQAYPHRTARQWTMILHNVGVARTALPRDDSAEQWARLWASARTTQTKTHNE